MVVCHHPAVICSSPESPKHHTIFFSFSTSFNRSTCHHAVTISPLMSIFILPRSTSRLSILPSILLNLI
ncbi:hypothetical protein L1887_04354 [Cichorium endivia]|nr:hypothetical protein L1887_04354 [Cichorium endivia]